MQPLQFGVRYDFRNPTQWRQPWQELYNRLLEQATLVDQLGYDSIWLSEHHFTEDGYCPSILALLGSLAARTSQARLGTFILLFPLYHPLRLAEDIATLDLISGGRMDLGIAAGYRIEEFAAHGIPLSERASRMNEGLEILIRAWSEERVRYHGLHFTFDGLTVEPKPLQKPHPPLWMGGESPAAIRRAAHFGCHFMPSTTGHANILTYHDELERQGRNPAAFKVALPRVVYVTDNPEQGWHELKDHLLYQHNMYCRWSAASGHGRHDGGVVFSSPEDLPRDQYIIGDPKTCITALESLRAKFPADEITLWAVLPGFDIDKATLSLERFAKEVMPHFEEI